jgi:hypothetical protein
MEEVSERAEQE